MKITENLTVSSKRLFQDVNQNLPPKPAESIAALLMTFDLILTENVDINFSR